MDREERAEICEGSSMRWLLQTERIARELHWPIWGEGGREGGRGGEGVGVQNQLINN